MYKSKKINSGSAVKESSAIKVEHEEPIESLYSSSSLLFSSQGLIDIPDKSLYSYSSNSLYDSDVPDKSLYSLYSSQDSKVIPDKSLYSYSSSSLQDSSSVGSSSTQETSSTPARSSTPATSSTSKKMNTKTPINNSSSRKGSAKSTNKDPQEIADEVARKRAKNTDAARRSRQRKVVKMETLEKQVVELTAENSQLKTRLTILEVEKKGLEEKNADKFNRISKLEKQLTEAHQGIINSSRKKEK